jgi:manganese/zinc/iron transport system permease protein
MIDWWNSLPIGVTDAIWTIAVGATSSIACAVLGCYLVLRRLSLIGDAISHAVLPGLVLAFLWTGTRNPVPMVIGAMALGLLTAFLTELFQHIGRVPSDSSMGVVFTSLFALGVILITAFASQIDIDPGCVLYGLIEGVVFDTIPMGGLEVPRALITMSLALLAVVIFVLALWKELKVTAFDPALATAMGINAVLVHYLLMSMVAMTTVVSFEAVGSILVIAMLIAPGATAHLLTDKLPRMLWISAAVAFLSAVFGYWWAHALNTSVAGMMAVAAGVQFSLAVFFAPQHGVLSRALHNFSVGIRVVREDALAQLWRMREREGRVSISRGVFEAIAGEGLVGRLALRGLLRSPLLIADGVQVGLSDAGMQEAARLVRAHRLWETYLTTELDRSPEAVHDSAHRIEHFLKPELTRQLDEKLKAPATDPHGHEIPR